MSIASATMTSKGQITLPAKLRAELGLKPGDRVDFERGAGGRLELVARTKSFADLRGILKTDHVHSDEEILAMCREARAGRWLRFAADDIEDGENADRP